MELTASWTAFYVGKLWDRRTLPGPLAGEAADAWKQVSYAQSVDVLNGHYCNCAVNLLLFRNPRRLIWLVYMLIVPWYGLVV